MSVAALTGLIPVVVAGGLVLKFADVAMPKPKRSRRRASRRTTRRTSGLGFGNFSSVGF